MTALPLLVLPAIAMLGFFAWAVFSRPTHKIKGDPDGK